jgi:hypothetical protein
MALLTCPCPAGAILNGGVYQAANGSIVWQGFGFSANGPYSCAFVLSKNGHTANGYYTFIDQLNGSVPGAACHSCWGMTLVPLVPHDHASHDIIVLWKGDHDPGTAADVGPFVAASSLYMIHTQWSKCLSVALRCAAAHAAWWLVAGGTSGPWVLYYKREPTAEECSSVYRDLPNNCGPDRC